jgi:hypothetical protein
VEIRSGFWYKKRFWNRLKGRPFFSNPFERGFEMKLVHRRFLVFTGLAVAVLLLAQAPSFANCGGAVAVQNAVLTGAPNVQGCGANGIAQFWVHKNAKWNLTSGATTAVSGLDSGGAGNPAVQDPGSPTGTYFISGDWNNPGVDGCCFLTADPGTGPCGSNPDPPATDMVLAGQDTANPTQALAIFGSVDFNPIAQQYILDVMGNPGGSGDLCGTDIVTPGPVFACAPVTPPSIVSVAPGAAGHLIYHFSFPAQNVLYPDDCNGAESSVSNCPRNMNAGRALMVRRGPCKGGSPVNSLAVTYVDAPASRTELWHPYSTADADYNGFQDAAPTTPNVITTIPGTAQSDVAIDFTLLNTVTAADNCLYVGAAAAGDAAPLAGNTVWLTPYVSMMRSGPVRIASFYCNNDPTVVTCTSAGPACGTGGVCVANNGVGTPAPDRVVDLKASKLGSGKYNVSWGTSGEATIAKFDLVGNKSGGSVEIKSVNPKGGGLAANYSVDVAAGDLKGSKQVSVVVTYTDGSKASFGPAPVE